MPSPLELTIGERKFGPVAIDFLAERLAELCTKTDPAELWLSQEDGPFFCLLKSGDRALLMFLRQAGDPGMTSRAASPDLPGTLLFALSNGQVDEYPTAWTVSFDVARQAAEHFYLYREPPPFVTWQYE